MSRIVNHDTKPMASVIAGEYLNLLPQYTGSDYHWFHKDQSPKGFNDNTNVDMELLEGFIDDFLQVMTHTVSKDSFEAWDNAGRFAACMTGDQLNHNVFTGFLTPLYENGGVEYGTAVICAADKDSVGFLFEDINRLKLMTYKREPAKAPELLADLSAMIESESTPRMFDRTQAPVNGTVFAVLSKKFEDDYQPTLEPTEGQVLTSRRDGTAADPSEVKRNVNEHFTHLIEKFSRRLDTLNNPNMIDPDDQTFWIEPVIEQGRRLFQIVDNEGTEQLEKPSAHRGEVFTLCIRMNHEAGVGDEG